MAINFPDTPALNDIHTVDGKSWKWDGTTWKSNASASVVTLPNYLPLVGGTLTGGIVAATPSTTVVPIRIPHGTAPSAPTNGDVWTTTDGLFIRVNGATVGPLGTAPYRVNAQGTAYTITMADMNSFVSMTGGTITFLNVAAHTAAPIGSWVGIQNAGAGDVTIGFGNNTIRNTPSLGLTIPAYGNRVFVKVSSNNWSPVGHTGNWEDDGNATATLITFSGDGSNTAPLIRSVLQIQTGQYFKLSGQGIGWSITGTERMAIDNAGLLTGTGTSLGAWTAWTPTIQGTGWFLGNANTGACAWTQIGKTIHFRVVIVWGSTSLFGTGQLEVSVPFSVVSQNQWRAASGVASTGSVFYPISAYLPPGTGYMQLSHDVSPLANVTSTVPLTWASGHSINLTGTVQAG